MKERNSDGRNCGVGGAYYDYIGESMKGEFEASLLGMVLFAAFLYITLRVLPNVEIERRERIMINREPPVVSEMKRPVVEPGMVGWARLYTPPCPPCPPCPPSGRVEGTEVYQPR